MRDGYRSFADGRAAQRPAFRGGVLGRAWRRRRCSPFPWAAARPGPGLLSLVDGGQIKLHMRARTGTRIEETAALCDAVEATIREVIPADQLTTIVDNLGLPYSGINLAYSTSAPVGPGMPTSSSISPRSTPTPTTCACCARSSRPRIRRLQFAFLPADMISQILNFGLPSPIDVQVTGFNVDGNREFANKLLQKLHSIPGRGRPAHPAIRRLSAVQRRRRSQQGAAGRPHRASVATNMLVSLSGSFQTTPSFWVDPKSGTQYRSPLRRRSSGWRISTIWAIRR
jgi:hypothetical protein